MLWIYNSIKNGHVPHRKYKKNKSLSFLYLLVVKKDATHERCTPGPNFLLELPGFCTKGMLYLLPHERSSQNTIMQFYMQHMIYLYFSVA